MEPRDYAVARRFRVIARSDWVRIRTRLCRWMLFRRDIWWFTSVNQTVTRGGLWCRWSTLITHCSESCWNKRSWLMGSINRVESRLRVGFLILRKFKWGSPHGIIVAGKGLAKFYNLTFLPNYLCVCVNITSRTAILNTRSVWMQFHLLKHMKSLIGNPISQWYEIYLLIVINHKNGMKSDV